MNKLKTKIYMQGYRKVNKERIAELKRKWYEKNIDYVKRYHKKYKFENGEWIKDRNVYYRIKNESKIKKRDSLYRRKNRDILRNKTRIFHQENLSSWEGYIPLKTQCQMCGEDIYFNNKNVKTSIRFDHRHNGNESIKDNPTHWLRNNKRTLENQKIWELCDFGMLCCECNRRLPTKNRNLFLENLKKYILFYEENCLLSKRDLQKLNSL